MKTLKTLTLILIALALMAQPVAADPARYNVGIIVDGKTVQCDPDAYFNAGENRTIVPIRFVAEALGYAVTWDAGSRTVTLTKGASAMQLQIDSTSATVNGASKTLDAAARIEKDRTFVPLRFVAENFGASVEWVQASMTVIIRTAVAVDDLRSDYKQIMQLLPGKTKITGRSNSLYYAASGTPGTFNVDFIVDSRDDMIYVYNLKPSTYDALAKIMPVYFPIEHEKVMQAIRSATQKPKDYTFEGFDYWVVLTVDAGDLTTINGLKMPIPVNHGEVTQ